MEIRTKAVVFYDEWIRSAREIGETYNMSERMVKTMGAVTSSGPGERITGK